MDTVYSLIEAVVMCLDHIRNDKSFNTESISKANGLFHASTQSDFIMSVIICKEILAYIRGLTIKLQGKLIELHQAHADVEVVKKTLEDVRDKMVE